MSGESDPRRAQPPAGLCASCRHVQRVTAAVGVRYILCRRSFVDLRFAKYPQLPVERCVGYEEDSADA